jgi:dihydroorotase
VNVLIKSARIIDQNSDHHLQTRDILIEKGTITNIAENISNPKNYKEVILENLHVSPGWFDSSVSFGEPGYEERETLLHGLEVAAKSGFTAVAVNPNTNPVIDHKASVEFLKNKAAGQAVELYPIGSLTQRSEGVELAELYDMKNSGAVAFGDYNKAISNANLMKIALLYGQNFDGLILSFPQDKNISALGFVNESVNSTRLGLKSIPCLAEVLQIARDLFILEYTGGKLHIPAITTVKSVKLIKEAKKKGLKVSCSVTPHHLTLTDDELRTFDANYKVTPPLRSRKDNKALQKGLKDGTIDMITTDHNPIDIENKNLEFEKALYGTVGLESFLGSLLKVLDLETVVSNITEKPRKVFGIPVPAVRTGEKADLTLFDPEKKYVFEEKDILSTSKNSVFLGKEFKGSAFGIFSNNQLVLK